MPNHINILSQKLEQWGGATLNYLPKLVLAALVFLFFYVLAHFIKKISLAFYQKTFPKRLALAGFISSAIQIAFIILGCFLTLDLLGLGNTLTKLIASAGMLGIVAGIALKDVASNAFAGLLVNTQRPFKKGDWVNLKGNYGQIKDIGWITTSIDTTMGQEVFVPNSIIYAEYFVNYSTFGKRRVVLRTGVSYGDDLDFVKKTALEEVHNINNLLKNEAIDFYFTEIGSSAYNFELRFWIKFTTHTDYLNAMSDIIMRIKKRFEQENIAIAYNVTTLDFGVKGGVNLFDEAIALKTKTAE